MRTGECCPTTGVYRPDCRCGQEVEIRRLDDAPACPVCKRPVAWTFVRVALRAPGDGSTPIRAPRAASGKPKPPTA
jgi:hypothetical protein